MRFQIGQIAVDILSPQVKWFFSSFPSLTLAKPKSVSLTLNFSSSRIFSGLMSRCTIPLEWQYSTASSTWWSNYTTLTKQSLHWGGNIQLPAVPGGQIIQHWLPKLSIGVAIFNCQQHLVVKLYNIDYLNYPLG